MNMTGEEDVLVIKESRRKKNMVIIHFDTCRPLIIAQHIIIIIFYVLTWYASHAHGEMHTSSVHK